ncbi:MAG: zinc-ribbon domain-containing protein, partial [Deltaproteobacteria bacterium]|nr:zinc-ribbon domain-containing protein [Deltaproteobacteria bacterium]
MDVVASRCKTEYEFDDALVSERGTTVKCTNCSHQFKIFRPPSESEGGRAWTLRRPDGTVIPF